MKKRGAIAYTAAGALLYANLAAAASPDTHQPRHHETAVDRSRIAIAARYAGCAITAVEHDSRPRVIDANGRHELRDHLKVSLRLTDTPQAERALTRYENDDTVFWQDPAIEAVLLGEDSNPQHGTPLQPAKELGATFKDHDMQPTAEFLPRHAHTTTDGVEAAIYAESNAATSDDKGVTTTVGERYCGTLVTKNGVWTAKDISWHPVTELTPLPYAHPIPAEQVMTTSFSAWQN
jgi:hypothetical protein